MKSQTAAASCGAAELNGRLIHLACSTKIISCNFFPLFLCAHWKVSIPDGSAGWRTAGIFFFLFLLNQKKCFTLQVVGTDRLEKMRPSIRCWTDGRHLIIFFFSGTLNRRPLLPFRLENRLPCTFRAEKHGTRAGFQLKCQAGRPL
jgi:hypothetical protein